MTSHRCSSLLYVLHPFGKSATRGSKYARHASVPRPPAEERAAECARWRRGKRERAVATEWTITPAEGGMSAAGRRLHGLDDPR